MALYNTSYRSRGFERRVESFRRKIRTLAYLRKILNLPKPYDLTERQWSVLNSQLLALQRQLTLRLANIARTYLPLIEQPKVARAMNSALGKLEFAVTKTFVFFDTFLDVLSQRSSPSLGRILAGAEIIALDSLRKNHPALKIIENPIVYFDRGFGASILRTGVPLPGGTLNELPLIQVPYSRITDKCNLAVGILHESAHEALVRLNIVREFPAILHRKLVEANAPPVVRQILPLWTKEWGPDFWGFLCCGIAQTAGIRDILSLPPADVFKVSFNDPHPAPWLRVLLSFEWAKKAWGDEGIYNIWEREWLNTYPLEHAPLASQRILSTARRYLPLMNDVLFHARFSALNGGTLPSLFDLRRLDPRILESKAASFLRTRELKLTSPPSEHIAMFAFLREKRLLREESLDRVMTHWFIKMVYKRNRDLVDNNVRGYIEARTRFLPAC